MICLFINSFINELYIRALNNICVNMILVYKNSY